MSKKTGCYVYAYLRSESSEHGEVGSPYYIGKGKHGKGFYARAFSKTHNVHIPSDKSNVVIFSDELTDNDARQSEMLLIHLHGRIDMGTGCLRNLTDGGEGCEGRILTEESRAKMSKSQKGKYMPPWTDERRAQRSISYFGSGNPFYGKTHSEQSIEKISIGHKGSKPPAAFVQSRTGQIVSLETRAKLSASNKGQVRSDETKEKMRAAKLGKPQSPEHVANVSKAITASWVKRREKYGSTGQSKKELVAA